MVNLYQGRTGYQMERVKNLKSSIGQMKGRLLFSVPTNNFFHLDQFKHLLDRKTEEFIKAKEAEPKHADIFSGDEFNFFRFVMTKYISQARGRVADINYFVQAMITDKGKIKVDAEKFRRWFNDTYIHKYEEDVELNSQLKKWEDISNQAGRNGFNIYNAAREEYKQQK